MNLSAIRTIRVLRPLRAINRIPSKLPIVLLLFCCCCKTWHTRFGIVGHLFTTLTPYALTASVHFFFFFFFSRYANSSHVALGHTPDARQRPAALLLRILHLWYRWRPTVGRHLTTTMLPWVAWRRLPSRLFVSWFFVSLFFIFFYKKIKINRLNSTQENIDNQKLPTQNVN